MYSDTITLFNLSESKENGDFWYPTIITGVHLQSDSAAKLKDKGAESTSDIRLHIRCKICGEQIQIFHAIRLVDGEKIYTRKEYLTPKTWEKMSNKADAVTFLKNRDFFCSGIWQQESRIEDLKYSKKGFYDFMRKNEDDVFLITRVQKHKLLPHFEIGGK